MKIGHVSYHGCIRAVKIALSQLKKHKIHFIAFERPQFWNYFDSLNLCHSVDHLRKAVTILNDHVDIFHVHNEPNWMACTVRETTDKPIVFDVHDSQDYRSDKPEDQSVSERLAFDIADGLVFVSEPCKEITLRKHQIDKPHCVLPSYVPRDFYKTKDWNWNGGIIYQGGTWTDKSPSVMQYANYKNLSEALKKEGIPFNVFTTDWKGYKKEYLKDIIFQGTLQYNELLKHLGHFDWGLIGNLEPYKDWQVALPNKLFEYMAGGLPILCMNAELCGEMVESLGIGIHVKTIEELKRRYQEKDKCRKNVFLKRHEFEMEKHTHVLDELYENLTGNLISIRKEVDFDDKSSRAGGIL